MKRLVLILIICALLACSLPTPTAEPTPTTTMTPTLTPTATSTPDVVSLPDPRTFALFVVAERGQISRYSEHLGVERGTKVYLKFEDEEGLHLAVFGDAGGKWGLLEVRDLTPTPAPTVTPTPWNGAGEAMR